MPVPSYENKNQHYASFATTSRLVACLTSESLVPVYYVPSTEQELHGLCLLLRPKTVQEGQVPVKVTLEDILAVVPLRGLPIIDNANVAQLNGVQCPRIDMVDGLDMLAHIYSINFDGKDTKSDVIHNATKNTLATILETVPQFALNDTYGAEQLWDRFAADLEVNGKLSEQIRQELGSSIAFQSKTPLIVNPIIYLFYSYSQNRAYL